MTIRDFRSVVGGHVCLMVYNQDHTLAHMKYYDSIVDIKRSMLDYEIAYAYATNDEQNAPTICILVFLRSEDLDHV